jgi:hypothetical protein
MNPSFRIVACSALFLLIIGCHQNVDTNAQVNAPPPTLKSDPNRITLTIDPSHIAKQLKADAPSLDNSTPDKTVKSYWALKDYLANFKSTDTADELRLQKYYQAAANAAADARNSMLSKITEKPMYEEISTKRQEDDDKKDAPKPKKPEQVKEIQRVDQETPTRAVVYIKLSIPEPIPSSIRDRMSEYPIKAHDEGITARYVLEKNSAGWQIENIQSLDESTADWKDRYGKANGEDALVGYEYMPSIYDL